MSEAGGKYESVAPELPELLPGFCERQAASVTALFDLLIPKIRSGTIDTIVDLGCGTGEILVGLAHQIAADRRGGRKEPVNLVGLDSDRESVTRAQKLLATAELCPEVTCRFIPCEDDDNCLDLIATVRPSYPTPVEFVRTAVLCLGHTIFHLPYLPKLVQRLKDNPAERPGLWIVDVYHSWDRVLSELEVGAVSIDEPRSYSKDRDGKVWLNALFTQSDPEDQRRVIRGLVSLPANADAPRVQRIATHQFAWSTTVLFSFLGDAQYVLSSRGPAVSGYGEMERIVLQRGDRIFPLPALFLDGKSIPRAPELTAEIDDASPMHVIARWIHDSGLVNPGGDHGFDFVMVEVAPYYDDPRGIKSLQQEVLLCTRPTLMGHEQMRQALYAYADELNGFLATGLSPFFHPEFAGYCKGAHWPPIHFSLGGPSIRIDDCIGSSCAKLLCSWRERLETAKERRSGSAMTTPPSFSYGEHVYVLQSNPLTKFIETVEDEKSKHKERVREDHGELTRTCHEDDLHAIHHLLHERARAAFHQTRGASTCRTVLMGIPLRSSLDSSMSDSFLPNRFRGGAWIFAGTRADYTPALNTLLGDLARLIVLLQIPAIDAKAAGAMSLRNAKALTLGDEGYEHAGARWRANQPKAAEVFRKGPHEVPQWHALGRERREKLFEELQVNALALALLNPDLEQEHKAASLDWRDAIVLVKAASKGQVSVRTIEYILGCGPGKLCTEPLDIGNMDSVIPQYNGPGQLVRALYHLATSSDERAITEIRKKLEPVFIDGERKLRVVFEAGFQTAELAKRARNNLQKFPWERIAERGSPGKGTLARYFLLRASSNCPVSQDFNPEIEMVNESTFRLEFTFKGSDFT